jgi:hypothetical protein
MAEVALGPGKRGNKWNRPKIHLYDYATNQQLKALMPQRVLLHSAALRMSCLGSETSAWEIPFEVKEPVRVSR